MYTHTSLSNAEDTFVEGYLLATIAVFQCRMLNSRCPSVVETNTIVSAAVYVWKCMTQDVNSSFVFSSLYSEVP